MTSYPPTGVGKVCSLCRYYEPVQYECRHNAPARALEGFPSRPYYPPTTADGWCGQWEPELRPVNLAAPHRGVSDLL